jgi:G3E family GTPase
MEAIIVIVGFLGTGKTTLLKKVTQEFLASHWNPFIILNDYENATIDVQNFLSFLPPEQIKPQSGSCICCTGIQELREVVNRIPKREKGITLIEANGTTDAASLMGFLGVGMDQRFLPPVQISVVDVRHWQKRHWNNELEANQIQVSSVIVLNFEDQVPEQRLAQVKEEIKSINPMATISSWDDLDITSFPELQPVDNEVKKMDHHKSHWASCSVDMPDPMPTSQLNRILDLIPSEILRVKGCTRLDLDQDYTHFERTPDGEIYKRQFRGTPTTGAKLLSIGPGSDPKRLKSIIEQVKES